MSHVATVDIEIRDLDALEIACRRVGVELVRDQKSHRYYAGHRNPCDHLIRIPGDEKAYEIGVVRRTDGRPGYLLSVDDFGGGLGMTAKVGPKCGLLKQAYATVVAMRQAASQGFMVQEQKLPNGNVRLVLSK